MHPAVKAYVKPVVEIMAALPSVVLGFLAGLWLAPMVERVVPGLFLLPLVLPVLHPRGATSLWRMVPRADPGPLQDRHRGVPARPGGLVGAWLAFALGGLVESAAPRRRLSRLAAVAPSG